MSIVTAVPIAIPFATSNLSAESVRRENTLRESIPQPSNSNGSSGESSTLGEDTSSRAFVSGSNALIYDRAQLLQNQQQAIDNGAISQGTPDNGQDQSAGREEAEARQQEQRAEQQELQELRTRDREVRTHEQAHAAVGGQFAGAPTYEFETGPDGRQYAVAGEVSIDISEESTAEETLRKAEIVRAAALAPAEPSPQDFQVANQAVQLANEARVDLAEERAEEIQEQSPANNEPETAPINGEASDDDADTQGIERLFPGAQQPSQAPGANTSNDNSDNGFEPIEGAGIPTAVPRASLEALQENAESNFATEVSIASATTQRDPLFQQRNNVISNFYTNISSPRTPGFSQVA